MLYPEFVQYKSIVNPANPLVNAYESEDGHVFYVEPGFYYGLMGLQEKRRDAFPRVLERMKEIVRANPKVVFTGNYETPFLSIDDAIYQEIGDITDSLGVFVEDKSRGSDYGD